MSAILLLGGTGAMGVYLTEILVGMGHRVFVTTRRAQTGQGVTYLQGNAHDDIFLRDCVERVRPDAIVDFMIYGTDEFRARVPFLLQASGHYLFLSSYRVHDEDVPLRETSPRLLDACQNEAYLQTDEYALTKARQENLIRATAKEGRHWTIIRPAITYSKARFQFGVLEAGVVCWRALRGLPLPMPREILAKRTTMTWGRDVAAMIARLILNPKAYGEAFITATAESHTWREVFEIYRDTLGATLLECSLDDYARLSGAPWQIRYDRMFDRVIDNAKVLAATGLTQADLAPLSVALPRELAGFRANPSIVPENRDSSIRMDAILGLPPQKGLSLIEHLLYHKVRHPMLAKLLPIRTFRAVRSLIRGTGK